MNCTVKIASILILFGSTLVDAQVSAPPQSGLKAPLKHFVVAKKTFESALRDLADRSHSTAVIGFEPATSVPGGPRLLNLMINDGTIQDALNVMCADGNYGYSEVQPGVIEVRATQEPSMVREVLSLPVRDLDLQMQIWPLNLFARAPNLIPELGLYLKDKALQWSRQTGRPIPGTPGISMETNIAPPTVRIHLQNTTVRGVLDAFAAYTLAQAAQPVGEQPSVMPSGWRVDFIPDAQAPTGLGGYLRWSAFP